MSELRKKTDEVIVKVWGMAQASIKVGNPLVVRQAVLEWAREELQKICLPNFTLISKMELQSILSEKGCTMSNDYIEKVKDITAQAQLNHDKEGK